MIIRLKRSFGGTGVTIDCKGKKVPILYAGEYELIHGEDYTVEETEKEVVTQIVFEWMENQSVYFKY